MKNISTFEEFIAKSSEEPKEDAPAKTNAPEDKSEEDGKKEGEEEANEGNAFSKALKDARDKGLKEFEFGGKKYKVFEGNLEDLTSFLAENFTLYPSYNNMVGSEVLRNIPITHQVNMAVYGQAYVIEMPQNKNQEEC
jgi:hypothetical protein